ncbi:recombinase family protein [Azospirillum argentinense]
MPTDPNVLLAEVGAHPISKYQARKLRKLAKEKKGADAAAKLAIGYIRTEDECSSPSFAEQETGMRKFCADHGISLVKIFSDVCDGRGNPSQRPGYSRMRKALASKAAGNVVVLRADRISERMPWAMASAAMLREEGGAFVRSIEHGIVTKSIETDMEFGFAASASAWAPKGEIENVE